MKEVLLGAYLPVILSVPVGMLLIVVFGPLRRHLVNLIVDPPFSPIPIIIALASAYFFRHRANRQPSVWIWILPSLILIWNLFTWDKYPGQVYWNDVWNNFFGNQCGSSECLNEFLVTAPVCSSLAYSIFAIVLRPKNPREHSDVLHPA